MQSKKEKEKIIIIMKYNHSLRKKKTVNNFISFLFTIYTFINHSANWLQKQQSTAGRRKQAPHSNKNNRIKFSQKTEIPCGKFSKRDTKTMTEKDNDKYSFSPHEELAT